MAIAAKAVIARVREVLNDTQAIRWLDPELLAWINDGRREMAIALPAVFSQTAHVKHALEAGCYQRLAATNAYAVASISHNVNDDGSRGTAIRQALRPLLDAYKPSWMADVGSVVQNWVADDIDPIAFYVYPAVKGGRIEVIAYITPEELVDVTNVALPFDQFLVPLVNYVLHRAYAKDAEVAKNAELSAAYLQLFTAAVSAKG